MIDQTNITLKSTNILQQTTTLTVILLFSFMKKLRGSRQVEALTEPEERLGMFLLSIQFC